MWYDLIKIYNPDNLLSNVNSPREQKIKHRISSKMKFPSCFFSFQAIVPPQRNGTSVP